MFILVLGRDISLNSELITTMDNNSMWDELPFCNFNLSIDWRRMKLVLTVITQILMTTGVRLKIEECILFT